MNKTAPAASQHPDAEELIIGRALARYLASPEAADCLRFAARIERRAIEFPVVAIGDADGAIFRLQFGTDQRQFAGKLVGPVGREVEILQDDTALVFVLF